MGLDEVLYPLTYSVVTLTIIILLLLIHYSFGLGILFLFVFVLFLYLYQMIKVDVSWRQVSPARRDTISTN
jgi:hypothetical protein